MTPEQYKAVLDGCRALVAGVDNGSLIIDHCDSREMTREVDAAREVLIAIGQYEPPESSEYVMYGTKGVGKSTYGTKAGPYFDPVFRNTRTIRQDELTADWVPERSSGYDGMRNTKTGEWCYYED